MSIHIQSNHNLTNIKCHCGISLHTEGGTDENTQNILHLTNTAVSILNTIMQCFVPRQLRQKYVLEYCVYFPLFTLAL